MKDMSRSRRRHHRQRMINRVSKYLICQDWNFPESKEDVRKRAVRFHNHAKVCSCFMCGNPRHNIWSNGTEKLTMQERKQLEKDSYEHNEASTQDD